MPETQSFVRPVDYRWRKYMNDPLADRFDGSFRAFVIQQSIIYPHLISLALFLERRESTAYDSTPNNKCDVIILEIDHSDTIHNVVRTQSVSNLREHISKRLPRAVRSRLFLVEDINQATVEALGSGLKCQPDVFQSHLQSVESRPLAAHVPDSPNDANCILRGCPTINTLRRQDYLSMQFRRCCGMSQRHQYDKGVIHRSDHSSEDALQECFSCEYMSHGDSQLGIFLFDKWVGDSPGDQEYDTASNLSRRYRNPRADEGCEIMHGVIRGRSLRSQFLDGLLQSATSDSSMQMTPGIARGMTLMGPVADPRYLMLIAICSIIFEWQRLSDSFAYVNKLRQQGGELSDGGTALHQMERLGFLRENVQMLKQSLKIVTNNPNFRKRTIKTPLPKTEPLQNDSVATKLQEAKDALHDLIAQQEDQIEICKERLTATTALAAIKESKKGVEQAESVRALTTLATFYIPLSFVSTFFGMNLGTLIPGSALPLRLYFVIAVPLTLISLAIVNQWNTIDKAYSKRADFWMNAKSGLLPACLWIGTWFSRICTWIRSCFRPRKRVSRWPHGRPGI